MEMDFRNSRGYALFIAILPVIMMYEVPGIHKGMSTVLIAGGMVYAGIVIIQNMNEYINPIIFPLIIFYLYAIPKCDSKNVLLCISVIVHITAISYGAVNVEYLRKYYEVISLFAAICVIIQFSVHLVTGHHIPMINIKWCLDEMAQYRHQILTGYTQENIYRPSAIFLEPSHLAKYCATGLASYLLNDNPQIEKAVVVSLGIFVTTSGMGIVMVFIVWGWWLMSRSEGYSFSSKTLYIIAGIFGLGILLLLLNKIPFFNSVLARITGRNASGYNAIEGRLFWWDTYFGNGAWKEMIFGFGTESLPDKYFTGVMELLYSYGIVGVCLFTISIAVLVIKTNGLPRLISILFIALNVFANLIGFISVISQFGFILAFYASEKYGLEAVERANDG